MKWLFRLSTNAKASMWATLASITIAVPSASAPAESPVSVESPIVVFETTRGDLVAALFPLEAPQTVENILELIDSGFYDGLIFHRVIAGFVVQTGGHLPDMQYRDAPRTVVNESRNGLRNRKYTLSMARRPDPDSAGAQFYINLNDNTHLDYRPGQPGYTVFGEIVEGTDVAEEIGAVETTTRNGMPDVPAEPIVIRRAYRR
ncbi:MAG: peptidylprolyl isomerase [Gammaproteobacteria bacterium]|nr:peptidylprolyl isomerase [Gammaproteobacteria bacterium]